MPSCATHGSVRLAATLFASTCALAQDLPLFFERSADLGLEHATLTGFDDFGEGSGLVRDYAQSGLAFGDLDGDGDQDLVAVGSLLANRLFLNPGSPLEPGAALSAPWPEIGGPAGIRSGELDRAPALGDYDRDGDLDLFVGAMEGSGLGARPGRGRLYDNSGAALFEDVTARAGTRGHGRTLFAQWYDLDLDGLLDLLTSEFHQTPNAFYRNEGGGSFIEEGALRGLDNAGSTHVTAIVDTNDDGYPDVVVGNDHGIGVVTGVPGNLGDALLVGDADGFFTDVSAGSGTDVEGGIMGLAFGDLNHDGAPDLYKTDLGPNHAMLNEGWPESGVPYAPVADVFKVVCGFFPNPGSQTGFSKAVGWATFFLDANHDGWDDLFVVNGHVAGGNPSLSFLAREQKNYLYTNRGPLGGFTYSDSTEQLGLLDGFDDRAAAWADLDLDGDLELALLETSGGLRLFESRASDLEEGWLEVALVAATSAPEGVGARVRYVDLAGRVHTRWIGADGPTAAQPQRLAHFGLGGQQSCDLEVRFPSGVELRLGGVPAGSQLRLEEPELIALSQRVLPAAGFQGPGDPDVLTVRAFAHGRDGVPLGPGAEVQIDVPGLQRLGGVIDNGDGSYRAHFATDSPPGAYRVQVAFGNFAPLVRPVVHLTGGVDAARSEVNASAVGVAVNSADEVIWSVVPRDASGVALGAGHSVALGLPGVFAAVALEDAGDGSYRRSVGQWPVAGVFAPQVTVDGVLLEAQVPIEVAGPADAALTVLESKPIRQHEVAAPNVIKLAVEPRDAAGRRLGSGAEVSVVPRPVGLRASGAGVSTRAVGPGAAAVQGAGAGSLAGGAGPGAGLGNSSGTQLEVLDGLDDGARQDGRHLFAVYVPQVVFDSVDSFELEVWVDGELLTVREVPLGF